MASRIVVLGAGFGGLELATILSERLGDGAGVTLIDQGDAFVFGYSKLDVMFGQAELDAVQLPYADFACDYVDHKQPVALEIQRRASGASETVWTYSQERADEASSSSKSLVETYGFDPTRWDVKL